MIDPQSDKSKTKLYSIMGNMENADLKTQLKGMTFDPASIKNAESKDFGLENERLFPINSKQNTMLSKVYFDMQHAGMSPEVAQPLEAKINRNLKLYGVPGDTFTYKQVTASDESEQPVSTYMLPDIEFCKVASTDDLTKAEALFDRGYQSLRLSDRVSFSRNFVKAASDLNTPITSDNIKKYAGMLESDTVNVQYMLDMRSALARRKGKDGSSYTKLAASLDDIDVPPTNSELTKLAEIIKELDVYYGISEAEYATKVPCPYGTVFNKTAAQDTTDTTGEDARLAKLTKPEIVAQYGEDALTEIETPDGEIDLEKLKNLDKVKSAYA